MADIFGQVCGANLGNTAEQECDVKLGIPVGLLSIKRNSGIEPSATIADTIYATLDELTRDNDPSVRIYPLMGIEDSTDNTVARTQATAAGTGNTQTLRDAKPAWTWIFWATICQWAAFNKFNGSEKSRDYYVITDTNQLVAIKRRGLIGGLRFSDFYVSPLSFQGNDTPSQGTISATYGQTREWRESLVVITPSVGELTDLVGLSDAQPIDLNAQPLAVAGHFDIGVTSGCGGGAGSSNLIVGYEDVLEDPDNWTVRNAKTKAEITVTSITANAGKTLLAFVMPTTGAYVAGDGVEFILGDVTTLTAADMPGFEGKSVIVPN